MGSGLLSIIGSIFQVINCTFYGNLGRGAIYDNGAEDSFVLNSILWGNNRVDIENPGGETLVRYSDVQNGGDYNGIWNIHDDPLFFNPEYGNFHLLADSPCIDTGHNWGSPSTDFEGDPRILYGRDGDAVDMGVDEYNPDRLPSFFLQLP